MAAFHYIVKAKIIRNIKGNGDIDFLEFERQFFNESPILARETAFQHYQSFVEILLEAKNKPYHSDKQVKKELHSFIDPGTKTKIIFEEEVIEFSDSFGNGIAIFLIIDTPKPGEGKKGDEIFIHGIGNIGYFNTPDSLILELERELEYYQFYEYNTDNFETEIVFCNSEEWEEGYLGNGEWLESYKEPNTYSILPTPFDWAGLDKPYWWREAVIEGSENLEPAPQSLEDIINGGESNQVEFKPSLLYNFTTKRAGIGIKGIIAKAICAFLNSNGGFLIIGLKDNGEPQGLNYDFSLSAGKNEKDFFKLEFDQMLKYFLSFAVKSNVSGDFYQLYEKDIFVVTVTPSKRGPIFLNGQNGKEFYVRGEASSRQLTDMEELVNYCIERWETK